MTKINRSGHARILDYMLWDGATPLQSIDFITSPNPPLAESSEGNYNHKGQKVKTDLLGENDGKLCVRRLFTEDYENRKLYIDFQWINDDDTINCTKKKTVNLSDAQWQSRFRDQRERIMDDLKGRASKYGAEHYIDILYTFFKDEKQDFVETGSKMFSEAVAEIAFINLGEVPDDEKVMKGTVKTILNESLDGVNKVYETLIFLTTL